MHRRSSSDAGMPGPSSRTGSVSSDRLSLSGLLVPSSVNPLPSYVALSAASQIVTDYHYAQKQDQLDEDTSSSAKSAKGALFSTEALALLNAFLDHLLFSFLSSAHSTSLVNLRPAIFEVLRPRLAREAVGNADEELQELLSSTDEEEELSALQNDQGPHHDWNLDAAWKRTRLRVMVYIRLGEMEDEDEERYLQEEEELDGQNRANRRFSHTAGLVSWAAAIFLTSIIEYVAEQTLIAAGQAAYDRIEKKKRQNRKAKADNIPASEARVVVEESDMEKVALSPVLGRLWRTWRKRLRAPSTSARSSYSHVYASRKTASAPSITGRRSSTGTVDDASHSMVDSRRQSTQTQIPENESSETYLAAGIPLPMSGNDVNEIEVPGLVCYSDGENSSTATPTLVSPTRPWSTIFLPTDSFDGHLYSRSKSRKNKSSRVRNARSNSLPSISSSPLFSNTSDIRRAALLAPVLVQKGRASSDDKDNAASLISEPQSQTALGNEANIDSDSNATAELPQSKRLSRYEPQVRTSSANALNQFKPLVRREHINASDTSLDKSSTHSSTRSASSSHKSSPRSYTTARPDDGLPIMRPEEYPDARDTPSSTDVEDDDPAAIGVARTSNISIPASPQITPVGRVHSKVTLISSTHERNFVTSEGIAQKQPLRRETATIRSVTEGDESHPTGRGLLAQGNRQDNSSITSKRASPELKTKTGGGVATLDDSTSKQRRKQVVLQPAFDEEQVRTQEKPKLSDPVLIGGSSPNRAVKVQNNVNRPQTTEKTTVIPMTKPSSEPAHIIQGSEAELERLRRMSSVKHSTEEKRRDFDQLVQGNETVKYTLTPKTMRQLEPAPNQPSAVTKVTVYPPAVSSGSFNPQQNSPPSRSLSKPTFGRSSSIAGTSSKGPSNEGFSKKETLPRPNLSTPLKTGVTEPAYRLPTLNNISSQNGRLAREPRIQTESTRDFAEFIRSTGPNKQPEPVLPFVSTKSTPKSSTPSLPRSMSLGSSRKNSKGAENVAVTDSKATSATERRRLQMEPRNAAVVPASGTAELIDFIRQGPPNSGNGQPPRISRSVAPFRTTMDSDDFGGLGERESESSLNQSVGRTSVNSRTGLLQSQHQPPPPYTVQKATTSGGHQQRGPTSVTAPAAKTKPASTMPSSVIPDAQPTRKQYRVKDPYMIESDDEDEDDDDELLTALPHAKQRPKQESMLDFLKAMEPEPSTRQDPRSGGTASAAAAATSASRTATQAAATRNATAAAARLGLQGAGANANAVPGGSAGRVVNSGNNRINSNRVGGAKPKYELRSAGGIPTARGARSEGRAATSELADFLRNSEPPEPKMATPAPLVNARTGASAGGKDGKESKSAIKFWKR